MMKYLAIFFTLTLVTSSPMVWVRQEISDTDFAVEIPKTWKVLCDESRKLVVEEKVRPGAASKTVLAVRAMDGGVPLEQCYLGAPTTSGRQCYRTTPGTPMPVEGKIGLPPGPGFGIKIPEEWLVPA